MKNLQQINLISHSLGKDREKLLFEIVRLNTLIQRKMELIEKMASYQHEYSNNPQFNLTRSVPALNKNLESFARKIQGIVVKEKIEAEKLIQTRDAKVEKLNTLDQKIKLMQQFTENLQHEMVLAKDKVEQLNMDDLSVIKKSRGIHD